MGEKQRRKKQKNPLVERRDPCKQKREKNKTKPKRKEKKRKNQ